MRSMKPSGKVSLLSDMWLVTVDTVSKTYITLGLNVQLQVPIGSVPLFSNISLGSRWGHSSFFIDTSLLIIG